MQVASLGSAELEDVLREAMGSESERHARSVSVREAVFGHADRLARRGSGTAAGNAKDGANARDSAAQLLNFVRARNSLKSHGSTIFGLFFISGCVFRKCVLPEGLAK